MTSLKCKIKKLNHKRLLSDKDTQRLVEITDKSIAKKPVYCDYADGFCPACKTTIYRDVWWLDDDGQMVNYTYCHCCGQKIDWSEEVTENE